MYQFKNWKLICEEKDREIARLKEELEGVKRVERLTRKHFRPGNSVKLIKENLLIAMYDKLYEYEDLEEQGLLLKLPCKVGDVLFNIENGEIESFVVEEFRICTYKIDRIEIYFENASGFGLCLFDGTLDEGWYKTLAEAEKALAEME